MIVRLGESQPVSAESGTYSGISINVNMVAAAVNVALTASDFKPQYISIKATKYEQTVINVMNDNLLILGNYNSFYNGRHWFINGYDKKLAAAGVNAVKVRSVFLEFKSPIRVDQGERLTVEINVSSEGTFTTAVNPAISYLDFVLVPTIGYDFGTPQTVARVIQQNSTSDTVHIGDNCLRALYLNLDQADLQNEVISSLSFVSDKLSYSRTFNQLLAQRNNPYAYAPQWNYGTPTLPAGNVLRGLDFLPQSFSMYDGIGKGHDLDNCRVDLSLNSPNVNPSQNYVVFTIYHPDASKIHKARAMQQKHAEQNLRKKMRQRRKG